MNLYVIRHGQMDPNLNHIITTYTDMPLNETGINQANNALKEVKNIDYDVIISSPLTRTRQTADIINYKKMDVIYDNRIVERNSGEYEGKSSKDVDLDSYWNYYSKNKVKGAEEIFHLFTRVYDFIDDIRKRYSNKTVLVVTHDGVCRALSCYFRGIPEDGDIRVYSQKNCELRKYDVN